VALRNLSAKRQFRHDEPNRVRDRACRAVPVATCHDYTILSLSLPEQSGMDGFRIGIEPARSIMFIISVVHVDMPSLHRIILA
jgi:hypothetical protein